MEVRGPTGENFHDINYATGTYTPTSPSPGSSYPQAPALSRRIICLLFFEPEEVRFVLLAPFGFRLRKPHPEFNTQDDYPNLIH